MNDAVKYEKRGRVAWITMNRPEAMNAINLDLSAGLVGAFGEAGSDDDILVVVFTGEGGRAFCAGMDLKARADADAGGKSMDGLMDGFSAVSNCLKPVIACIDGYALAGGMQLSARADFRIATEKSKFGMPESRRSLLPVGMIDTPELFMSMGEAKWILYSGAHVSAERMYQLGFLHALVPDRQALFTKAEEMIEELMQAAPLAIQATKFVLKTWQENPVNSLTARNLAAHWFERVDKSEDRLEGPKAFAEKRKPNWKGR